MNTGLSIQNLGNAPTTSGAMAARRMPGRVAVVGGGLSGLAAAYQLKRSGVEVQVFERSGEVGGRTRTVRRGPFVFDTGAITLLPTYARVCALIAELGISAHLHRVRPIVGIPRGTKIHELDLSRPVRSLLCTSLISWRSKLSLLRLLGPLRKSWNHVSYQNMSSLQEWDGESVADYMRRDFNEEIEMYIAGPIIRGNTLNETDCAPAGELLWMLRQYAAPYVLGLDKGINFLAETLATRVPVRMNCEVTNVTIDGAEVCVTTSARGKKAIERFDGCVLGLPPAGILSLAPMLSAGQNAFLQSIKPLPSVSLHVGLRQRPATRTTFILPPRKEQPDLTTIVMDHLKCPGRCPDDKGQITFMCRDTWSAENFERPDAEILDSVLSMARPFVGDLRDQVETYFVQRWPYAILKSEPGLYHRMAEYEAGSDPTSRVQLAGDFLSNGMEAAVTSGQIAASHMLKVLRV